MPTTSNNAPKTRGRPFEPSNKFGRRIAGFHVGDPDAVDEVVVIEAAQGVDRPAVGGGIGIEMAVEQETGAAAGTGPASDRVETSRLDLRQVGGHSQLADRPSHETGQLALAGGAAVGLDAHHRGQELERVLIVNPVEKRSRCHR